MADVGFIRSHRLPTVSNLRDFGGYETLDGGVMPRGLLYRSAHLGRLDAEGVKKLQSLGIRTVIDLRGKDERTKALPDLREDEGLEIVSTPVEPGALKSMIMDDGREVTPQLMRENIINTYRRFGREASLGFGAALEAILMRSDKPILIHCTAGKDRTGFTVAIIQLLLGVPRDKVFEDYVLTNTLWDRAYEGSSRFPPEVMAPGLLADEAYLQAALDIMSHVHGGIAQFAAAATGIPDYAERLRSKLLAS